MVGWGGFVRHLASAGGKMLGGQLAKSGSACAGDRLGGIGETAQNLVRNGRGRRLLKHGIEHVAPGGEPETGLPLNNGDNLRQTIGASQGRRQGCFPENCLFDAEAVHILERESGHAFDVLSSAKLSGDMDM